MKKIKSVHAREILDSRGNPTVEVDLILSDGTLARASVPSGASTGSHEAVELRDNDAGRYGGMGVLKAVSNVNNEIKQAIVSREFDQRSLDSALISLDGTKNKSRLGANAILGVSLAFAKASANSEHIQLYKYFNNIADLKQEMRLPIPFMNVINGGKHAVDSVDIQEYMIVPHGFQTFSRALQAGVEVFHTLGKILRSDGYNVSVGDEGGYAPKLKSNESALEYIIKAIEMAGYKTGTEISLALDVAATEIYNKGKYELIRDQKSLNANEMVDWYVSLVDKYPIKSIEDGLAEDDWDGYKVMTEKLKDIQLVGDDLFATSTERLSLGIKEGVANSILIKLNQIGTVSETIDVMSMANKSKYSTTISHRSGETEDIIIADFAIGTGAGMIKTGSLSRGERVSKYNQILRIEEELGSDIAYAKMF